MGAITREYHFFKSQSRPMRTLLSTNAVYAFVIPLIELFVGAYIIRNSNDFSLVIVYQLAQGTGIPVTFLINGYLLRKVSIKLMYGLGMTLSGISMAAMMLLGALDVAGVAVTGLFMGLAYGFFWGNRVFLALKSTTDNNRNYYYGLEALFFTTASIVMPMLGGYIIASPQELGWFGGQTQNAYYALTGLVFVLALTAASIIWSGRFANPKRSQFLFRSFHRLWKKMLLMASLKGVAQGFVIAAPVMLIMRLVGNEGSVGSIQSVGAGLSAVLLYVLGRYAAPRHRVRIFALGLSIFLIGAIVNMAVYNVYGAIFFVGCLVFARPLLDLAYFPIQLGVIDCVSNKEKRNQFAYIFSHEVGLYMGRVFGCVLFIATARNVSEDWALRYALLIVALVQFFGVFVARSIVNDPEWCEAGKLQPITSNALKEPAELGAA